MDLHARKPPAMIPRALGLTSRLKLLGVGLASLVVCTVPKNSVADDREKCVASYEKAQSLRKKSQLLEARAELSVCVQPSCPAVLRTDCSQWIEEVERDTPTLVVSVTGKDGRDVVVAQVLLDGQPAAAQIDGKPIRTNPGPHTVRVEIPGEAAKQETVVLTEGQKNRAVLVTYAQDKPAQPVAAPVLTRAPEVPEAPVPTLTWVLGAVGVAGLASFGVFAGMGASKRSDLDAKKCKPHCNPDDVSPMNRDFLIADISLGVGLMSLGGAVFTFFRARGTSPSETPATSKQARVRIAPTPSGVVMTGSF